MFRNSDILLLSTIFILSFCITFLYRKWAISQTILDFPSERSSHVLPTPVGGGIVIILTFYLGLTHLFISDQITKDLLFALIPGLLLAIIGFYDDIKKLNWLFRLAIQFICSGLGLFFLGGMKPLFGDNLIWMWSIITMIGAVWFINLFNFLDGSDGYASIEAISISTCLWFFTGNDILLIITFSVGGFLIWNWPPAKIFLGDSGSTSLGYIFVILGIYYHNNNILDFSFWIILTTLFWFDATITILRRIINKEKLNSPHKNHIYQRLIKGGFSHLRTLLAGVIINILLFLICLAISYHLIIASIGIIIAVLIMMIASLIVDNMVPFLFRK